MKEPIERVYFGNEVLAIIVRTRLILAGHNFPSDPRDSLQLGVNYYASGKEIRPHRHRESSKSISDCAEVIVIDEGRCEVKLFSDAGDEIYDAVLEKGDTIVCLRGGHAFRFLEPTRIIEVKQGPYLGNDYKIFLDGAME